MIIAKVLRNFIKSEIKNKVIAYAITLLFLNMVVISAVSYFISSSSILDRITTANAEILNQSMGSIDFILKLIENSVLQEFDEIDLAAQLSKASNGNTQEVAQVDEAINSTIDKVMCLRNEIDYVYVIGDDSVQEENPWIFSNESYARLQVINAEQIKKNLVNKGDSFVWTYVIKEGIDIETSKKIGLCRAIFDKRNKYCGFLLIMLRENVIDVVYNNLFQQNRQVYLVDQDGLVVSSPDKGSIGIELSNKFSSVKVGTTSIKEVDNKKYVVSSALSLYTGWKLYMIEPQKNILSAMNTTKWWIGIALLTCVSVFIMLSIFLSSMLTKPIKKLKNLAISINNGEKAIETFNMEENTKHKKLKSITRKIKFRTKLFIMLFTIIIIPVIVLMTVTYYVSYDIVKTKAYEINRLYAKQTRMKLEYYISTFEKCVYDLYAEIRLRDILSQLSLKKGNIRINTEDKKIVDDVFVKMIDKNREIMYLQLTDAKRRIVSNTSSEKQIIPAEIFDRVFANDETKNIWYGPYNNYFKQYVLTLGKKIKNTDDFTTIGCIFTSLKEADLEKVYRYYDEAQNSAFIIDNKGIIISHPNKNLLNVKADSIYTTLLEKGYQQAIIKDENGDSKMVSFDTIENTGWIIVHISLMSSVMQNMKQMLSYYTLMLLLTSISIAFISFKVSRKIGKPINELGDKVSKFAKGDLSFDVIEMTGGDEIVQLNNSFIGMLQRIRSLIEEVYEAKIRKNEAELNSKEAELTLLQAQINPHFLYNTLEIIRWKAMFLTNGENEVTEIVSTLSDFFRLSLSKGKKIVTLKDEIEHAANYITIMNHRYNNKIVVKWEVDESLLDCSVPKIILQPLVENAIYHGVKMKPNQGRIEVHVRKKENEIELEVRDDGAGMSIDSLEHLNSVLAGNEAGEKSGYGLRNVNQRIKLVFGEKYGLRINSILNYGTSVFIWLPEVRNI